MLTFVHATLVFLWAVTHTVVRILRIQSILNDVLLIIAVALLDTLHSVSI